MQARRLTFFSRDCRFNSRTLIAAAWLEILDGASFSKRKIALDSRIATFQANALFRPHECRDERRGEAASSQREKLHRERCYRLCSRKQLRHPSFSSAASLLYHSVAKHTEKHINLNFIYVRRRRHKNAART